MSYKKWIMIVVASGLGFPILGGTLEAKNPNIVLIIADDLGFSDLGWSVVRGYGWEKAMRHKKRSIGVLTMKSA